MHSDKILLLGYPIDAIPKEKLRERIAYLMEVYEKEKRPQFATTLSSLFLGQLSSCNLNHLLRPEVTESLRLSDLIGLDSPFLQFLAASLGQTIPHPIQAEDLLVSIASLLAEKKESLYLVGGDESLCHQVAAALKADYPGLKIAGVESPHIYIKGDRLEESLERDPFIVDAINEAKPKALIIQLGHPKQELWFQRIKSYIKIPIVIAVGAGFESYLHSRNKKTTKRFTSETISWNQLKRRLVSTLHYSSWLPPLLLYHTINRLIKWISIEKKNCDKRLLFLAEKESLTVLPFPSRGKRQNVEMVSKWMDEALDLDNIVLDFSSARHLNLKSLGLLYQIWKMCFYLNKNFFILGVSEDIKWLLKLHGAWNLIESHVCTHAEDVLDRLSVNMGLSLKEEREFISIQQDGNETHLSIFGRLHGINTYPHSLRQLAPILDHQTCIINLCYCSYMTQRGLGFLLKLREHQIKQKQKLILESVSKRIMNELKETNLLSLFQFR